MLGDNATLMPPSLGDNTDLYELLDLQVQKATAAVTTSVSGSLAAADPGVNIAGQTVVATNAQTQQTFAATTLADGSFVFPELAPGDYSFDVSDELLISAATATVSPGETLQAIVLPVSAGAQISGTIFDRQNGNPVPSAIITATNDSDKSTYVVQTDASGNYLLSGLEPGLYDLATEDGDFAPANTYGVDVSTTPAVVDVQLSAGSTISGAVNLQSGGQIAGATTITGIPQDGGSPVTIQTLTTAFELEGLSAGTYDLSIANDGYVTQTISDLTVSAGQILDIGTVRLPVASTISGRISASYVSILQDQQEVDLSNSNGQIIARSLTDSGGDFAFSGLPSGTYTINVPRFSDFSGQMQVTLGAAENLTDLVIQILPGGAITGVVSDSQTGTPIANALVYLVDGAGNITDVTTNSTGQYAFDQLNLGSYRVYVPSSIAASAAEVNITSLDGDSVEADLQADVTTRITGVAEDASGKATAGSTIDLFQSGQLVAQTSTEADGSYSFLLDGGGIFDLLAISTGVSFEPVSVSVSAGSTIQQNFTRGFLDAQDNRPGFNRRRCRHATLARSDDRRWPEPHHRHASRLHRSSHDRWTRPRAISVVCNQQRRPRRRTKARDHRHRCLRPNYRFGCARRAVRTDRRFQRECRRERGGRAKSCRSA